ncbi:hypothetical protein [Halomonas elongata]|uniref:hypothetical protein n=1 Tax=Halomonas elongata TaxID=2746 RepID=UPI00186B5AA8|nr:hypothetical protein [Halomonas elongata]MBW5802019.1 hypothetical protein [Halomonas elongata]
MLSKKLGRKRVMVKAVIVDQVIDHVLGKSCATYLSTQEEDEVLSLKVGSFFKGNAASVDSRRHQDILVSSVRPTEKELLAFDENEMPDEELFKHGAIGVSKGFLLFLFKVLARIAELGDMRLSSLVTFADPLIKIEFKKFAHVRLRRIVSLGSLTIPRIKPGTLSVGRGQRSPSSAQLDCVPAGGTP